MAYASLSIDLKAQLANLQSGMDKAVRLAEKDAARIEKAFGAVKILAGTIGGALAAGLGGATFTAFIVSANDALLAIKDLAEGTGSTVENVSALENALRANNRTLAEAQPILVKFNGALKEADGKNGISQALQAIGLSAEELRKLDPVLALQQVGQALQGYEDNANKARLVQELFGKSVAEVIPFLNDLAEAQLKATDGIVEATEEADKFEKNLAKLKAEATDLARALAGPVVSGLNKMFDAIKQFEGSELKSGLIYANEQAQKELQVAVRKMEGLQGLIEREGVTPGRLTTMQQLRDDAAKATAELQRTSEALKRIGRQEPDASVYSNEGRNSVKPSVRQIGGSTLPRPPRTAAGPRDLVGPEIPDALTSALRLLEQTDVRKLEGLKAQLAELLTLRAAGGDSPALAEAITDLSLAIDELNSKQFAPAVDIKSDFLRAEKAGYEETDDFLRKLKDKGQEVDSIAGDLGLTFSSAFEDAIVGGKGLREVLAGIEQDILRIITRKLVTEPLGNAITGLIKGATGDGGFDLGGLLSKVAGSLFGGLPGFAVGTDYVPRDMVARIHKGERIVPAAENKPGAGRALSVVNNFNFAGPVDRRTQMQVGAAAGAAVQRALARNG